MGYLQFQHLLGILIFCGILISILDKRMFYIVLLEELCFGNGSLSILVNQNSGQNNDVYI